MPTSFEKTKNTLIADYERNVQVARRRNVFGATKERRRVPVLRGDSGIGKTACAREVAQDLGFEMIALDCSSDGVDKLVIHLENASSRIEHSEINGVVLLLGNFDEASEEFVSVLKQYCGGSIDVTIQVVDVTGVDHVPQQIRYKDRRVKLEGISEKIFIVAEQGIV